MTNIIIRDVHDPELDEILHGLAVDYGLLAERIENGDIV